MFFPSRNRSRQLLEWGWALLLSLNLTAVLWLGLGIARVAQAQDLFDPGGFYQERGFPSFDGTGRFYLEREIAQPMGHQGASWLERSRRAVEEQPQKLLHALDLKPADVVADIGAGTGYMSLRLSRLVPKGRVLAVDVQPEMLALLEQTQQERGITNVETILGEPADPHLAPESVDLVLMVDAYHEFAYPREMLEHIVAALKPNGRVALVEYRGEDPFVFIKPLHKMTEAQVKRELQSVGLAWQETIDILPQQHLIVFSKS